MKYYKTELINQYLEKNKMSKRQFCQKCGISTNILSRIYANDGKIRLRYIIRIIKFLQIYPSQLLTF